MNFAEVVLKEIDNKVKFHYHKGKSCFFINLKQSKVVIKDFNLDNISFIQKVNDFINFKLKPEILLKLLESKDISNSKVLIEHTSANPISNLHIGNLRVAYFGESLRRLNLYMGNKVVTQYYVNDLGNQAAISLMCYLKYPNIKLNELYSYYCKNTKEFSDSELKELIYKIEQNDKNLIKELSKIVKFNLDLIFKELQNLNIIIDQFIFESDINVQGQEFIKLLISEGIAKQKGNMVYYPIIKMRLFLENLITV
jgi:arginyl-tRNA synthetase